MINGPHCAITCLVSMGAHYHLSVDICENGYPLHIYLPINDKWAQFSHLPVLKYLVRKKAMYNFSVGISEVCLLKIPYIVKR